MNHGREKGKNKKPIKKRREGYTGMRKLKEKEIAIEKVRPIKRIESIRPTNVHIIKNDEESEQFRKQFMEKFLKGKKDEEHI